MDFKKIQSFSDIDNSFLLFRSLISYESYAKFEPVPKLRNNKIRFLTAGQLKGLDSLQTIDLFDNQIQSLGGDMFIAGLLNLNYYGFLIFSDLNTNYF